MPGLPTIEDPFYLQNTQENIIPEESTILGKLPSYVNGTVLAVAPGIFDLPKGCFNHWLDGLALLQSFEINDSTVKFTKRFVQSDSYKRAIKAEKPCSVELGTHPSVNSKKGILAKLKPFGPYDLSDNCTGGICKFGSDTFLMSDTFYFHKIDPQTLETHSRFNSQNTFGLSSLTPFPFRDNKTGDLYNIGTSASNGTLKYHVIRMKAGNESLALEKKFETICTIPSRWFSSVSFIRCFGVSENYVVFVEQAAAISVLKFAATNLKEYTVRDWIEWKNHELNRFYLIDKRSGVLKKLEIYSDKPFHSLTVLNVFEEEDSLIFDCITVPNLDTMDSSFLNRLRDPSLNAGMTLSVIDRFIIPLKTLSTKEIKNLPENTNLLSRNTINSRRNQAKVIRKGRAIYLTPESSLNDPVTEAGIDFGQINKLYKGKSYSYFFGSPSVCSRTSKYFGKVCKVDMTTGDVKTWTPNRNEDDRIDLNREPDFVSIPTFVPNPNYGAEEDDGVLITTVTTVRKEDRNFLVFINGKSFDEIGRCYFDEKIAVWISASHISLDLD